MSSLRDYFLFESDDGGRKSSTNIQINVERDDSRLQKEAASFDEWWEVVATVADLSEFPSEELQQDAQVAYRQKEDPQEFASRYTTGEKAALGPYDPNEDIIDAAEPVADEPEQHGFSESVEASSEKSDEEIPELIRFTEREDPTAQPKRSRSWFSEPTGDAEKVPHEKPVVEPSVNSSNGWKKMREDGPEQDQAKIKDFFGGETSPVTCEEIDPDAEDVIVDGGPGDDEPITIHPEWEEPTDDWSAGSEEEFSLEPKEDEEGDPLPLVPELPDEPEEEEDLSDPEAREDVEPVDADRLERAIGGIESDYGSGMCAECGTDFGANGPDKVTAAGDAYCADCWDDVLRSRKARMGSGRSDLPDVRPDATPIEGSDEWDRARVASRRRADKIDFDPDF